MAIARPAVQIALRNILVASDFSACSERAIEHALAIARHYGATLHFANVAQPMSAMLAGAEGYANSAQAVSEMVELARRDMEAVARRGMAKYAMDMLDHRVWISQGEVWEMLHDLVVRQDIDLVVLGTHGRRGLKKMFLGSVAEEVFRHCRCPVLTIGPSAPGKAPVALRSKHVLFPTDLSPESLCALPYAMAPLQEFRAAVTVLHVAPVGEEREADRAAEWREIEWRLLGVAGPDTPLSGVEFALECGPVAETILHYAERRRSDLIVLGLKPPDSYAERLPWLEAYKVACAAPCPVLTVRAPSAWD